MVKHENEDGDWIAAVITSVTQTANAALGKVPDDLRDKHGLRDAFDRALMTPNDETLQHLNNAVVAFENEEALTLHVGQAGVHLASALRECSAALHHRGEPGVAERHAARASNALLEAGNCGPLQTRA